MLSGLAIGPPLTAAASPPKVVFLPPVFEPWDGGDLRTSSALPATNEPVDAGLPAAAESPGPTEAEQASPAPTPCSAALAWVEAAGLRLPAGVDYRCPSTDFAHHGAACWNASGVCPGAGFIAINMDRMPGVSVGYLRHVVAHEVCHIVDFQGTGKTSEAGADACAEAHGAPA